MTERLRSTRTKDILPLALLFIVGSNPDAQTNELNQIEEFVDKYEETWQSHDAARLAAFFTDDSDMILGIQPRIVGQPQIEAWWNRYFARLDSGRLISLSIDSIRILSPDVALLNVDTTTGGSHSETNEVLEARKARGTWVVTRRHGDWKISALRAHSPVGELRERPGTDN